MTEQRVLEPMNSYHSMEDLVDALVSIWLTMKSDYVLLCLSKTLYLNWILPSLLFLLQQLHLQQRMVFICMQQEELKKKNKKKIINSINIMIRHFIIDINIKQNKKIF